MKRLQLGLIIAALIALLFLGGCAEPKDAGATSAQEKQAYSLLKNAGTEQQKIKDR